MALTLTTAKPSQGMQLEFHCCTYCDWFGALVDAAQDGSVAQQGALCPDCFSHVEPVTSELGA